MNKVVRLGRARIYDDVNADVYAHVEFDGKRLSITGVEGPQRNGGAIGSVGQISQPEEMIDYAPGWDAETVARFFATWQAWHLNDMRAGCEHQRANAAEWEPVEITLYHYRLKPEIEKAIRDEEKRATEAVKTGEPFQAFAGITTWARMPRQVTTGSSEPPGFEYVPNEPQYTGDTYNRPSEKKFSNWIKESEHPRGTLSKPCPICGYEYGSRWLHEDVPGDVIEWLESLPETDKTPAWV